MRSRLGKVGMREHDKQKEQPVQRPCVRKKGVTHKGLNIPKDLDSGWWWVESVCVVRGAGERDLERMSFKILAENSPYLVKTNIYRFINLSKSQAE